MSIKTIKLILLSTVTFFSSLSLVAEDSDDEYEFSRLYFGSSATLVIPQGGSDMRRLGGATVRLGYYVSEALSIETDVAWLENCAGLGVQGLWHFWGYERFDPFVTFGGRGWIDGDLGPVAGLGAFYHLTDNWSLRADSQAILGIDSDCKMIYSLGIGVQYTF